MKNLVSFFSFIYYATKILVILSLINWWFSEANAQERVLVSDRKLINLIGDGVFKFKQSIDCKHVLAGYDPYDRQRGKVLYNVCADNTITFDQPDSTGYRDWNGYCGQTAVSNLAGMLCRRFIHPELIDDYATDITPGTLPETNQLALNLLFRERLSPEGRTNPCPKGRWTSGTALTKKGYLAGLREALWQGPGEYKRRRPDGSWIKITPVPVFIASGVQNIHWVTLVDFHENKSDKYGCDAVLNTWGMQKHMTCERLVDYGFTPIYGFRYLRFN